MARYAAPILSPSARHIENVSVEAGHEKVTLVRGSLAPVLAGEETIGFFFRGEGSWAYVCDSADEFAVVRRNLDQVTHWKAESKPSSITVSDTFTEVLWIDGGNTLPSGRSDDRSLAADFQKHLDLFARVKTDSLAQRLAYRALGDPSGRLAWAEFSGGKDACIHVFDDVEDHAEFLYFLKKNMFDAANAPWEWRMIPVSDQPIGRPFRQAAPVPVRLTGVDAELEADGEHAKVTVVETLQPADAKARAIRLNLQSRIFFGSALDIRPERLLRVTDDQGSDVPFDHRNGTVLLEVPQQQASASTLKLKFEIEGDLLYRPNGDSFWLLGNEPWFPRPDLAGSSFTWKCRVKVKAPFVPILNGRQTATRKNGDWNEASSEFDHPIMYPVVIAGKYNIDEETIDGRLYRIASYAYTNHGAAKHLATLSSQIIKFYEPFLGPFPWPEFTVVEINSYGFGVAPPGMMFITREAFSPHEDDLTKLLSQGLNQRFAHEIAHQYWGNQVLWADDQNEWLSESFAEYCSGLALKRIKGEASYRSQVGDWQRRTSDVRDHASIATANRLHGERSFFDRTNLLYGKGPYLLYVLNQELGEETFLTALKTYQSNRKWRGGSTALFEDLVEFLSKKSQADFFNRYYWGTETPKAGEMR